MAIIAQKGGRGHFAVAIHYPHAELPPLLIAPILSFGIARPTQDVTLRPGFEPCRRSPCARPRRRRGRSIRAALRICFVVCCICSRLSVRSFASLDTTHLLVGGKVRVVGRRPPLSSVPRSAWPKNSDRFRSGILIGITQEC
jgi:hypothetical protein